MKASDRVHYIFWNTFLIWIGYFLVVQDGWGPISPILSGVIKFVGVSIIPTIIANTIQFVRDTR